MKYYGTVEGVFDLVRRNCLSGVTQNIYPGDVLEVADVPPGLRVSSCLSSHDVTTIEERIRGRGIGYDPLAEEGRLRIITSR